jgi:hypothetical protein
LHDRRIGDVSRDLLGGELIAGGQHSGGGGGFRILQDGHLLGGGGAAVGCEKRCQTVPVRSIAGPVVGDDGERVRPAECLEFRVREVGERAVGVDLDVAVRCAGIGECQRVSVGLRRVEGAGDDSVRRLDVLCGVVGEYRGLREEGVADGPGRLTGGLRLLGLAAGETQHV